VPGDYAAAEAMKALSLGLHVMLFSDNVDIDEELAVKRHAEGVSEDVKAISPILWVQNRITPNKVGKCKSARQTFGSVVDALHPAQQLLGREIDRSTRRSTKAT
jgi:hypothetical protein